MARRLSADPREGVPWKGQGFRLVWVRVSPSLWPGMGPGQLPASGEPGSDSRELPGGAGAEAASQRLGREAEEGATSSVRAPQGSTDAGPLSSFPFWRTPSSRSSVLGLEMSPRKRDAFPPQPAGRAGRLPFYLRANSSKGLQRSPVP